MLDCTLRDGGWVNDFRFGKEGMQSVFRAVEGSGIEYVELGYLDAQKGSWEGRSEYSDTEAIDRNLFVYGKNSHSTCLAMIDYGKYPMEKLPACTETGIDGIRLCFHKKHFREAIQMGQEILDKGYRLMLQPMVCTRYTDEEFKQLISLAQEKLKEIEALYIVDSFGAMGQEDVCKRLRLADDCLDERVSLGLHTHNNMRLSFRNAAAALDIGLHRKLMIDGTLAGIGKGPGNLKIEEFAEYLNQTWGKTYDVRRLKDAAERIISPIKEKYPWGYRREFYLSAKYCLTPSYAKLFFGEYHLNLEAVDELLTMIPEENKDSFDRGIAELVLDVYRKKNEKVKPYDRFAGCQGI